MDLISDLGNTLIFWISNIDFGDTSKKTAEPRPGTSLANLFWVGCAPPKPCPNTGNQERWPAHGPKTRKNTWFRHFNTFPDFRDRSKKNEKMFFFKKKNRPLGRVPERGPRPEVSGGTSPTPRPPRQNFLVAQQYHKTTQKNVLYRSKKLTKKVIEPISSFFEISSLGIFLWCLANQLKLNFIII